MAEKTNNFNVRVNKLRKPVVDIYFSDMQRYNEMQREMGKDEEERKAMLIAGDGQYNLGSKAARGKGFIGTQVQDLLEKKSKVICKAKKKHRFKACSKCAGCRRENCGQCEFCLDMPKYGGMQILKQKCKHRVCVNPTVQTCDKCEWTI